MFEWNVDFLHGGDWETEQVDNLTEHHVNWTADIVAPSSAFKLQIRPSFLFGISLVDLLGVEIFLNEGSVQGCGLSQTGDEYFVGDSQLYGWVAVERQIPERYRNVSQGTEGSFHYKGLKRREILRDLRSLEQNKRRVSTP